MQVVPILMLFIAGFAVFILFTQGGEEEGGGGGYNYKSEEAFKTCIYFISFKFGWKIQISHNKYWMHGEMALTLKAVTAPQTF